jgi:hypothetical protein
MDDYGAEDMYGDYGNDDGCFGMNQDGAAVGDELNIYDENID